ncbi:DUF3301 domain-containing protein [Luteimonas arsenica]|uniref:DUF3301 domain-containing protein n=1 Tax=Luteimonas arsenica TaxID=1586242 RepID=UPI001055EDED|nr:DUF3301 domain-containing protein [Luteimonas arsenica]
MPSLILLMIAGAFAYAWWNSARAASEHAIVIGRSACRAAGVQLLDQTVHAIGLKLRRRDDGRLGLERSFRFEYSYDGADRHRGLMVFHGERLVSFTGPAPAVAASLSAGD